MSHQRLKEVLNRFINGDVKEAEAIFHDIVVEKARSIYEELEASIEEELSMEADDDYVVGGEDDEFVDDVEADVDGEEMDPEDMVDMETDPDAEFEMEDEDEDIKGEVEELSDKMDELLDMFKGFMEDEMDEPEHSDGDETDPDFDKMSDELDDMKSEACMDEEGKDAIEEATDFLDRAPDTGMKDEGKYEGTGDKSEKFNPNVDSLFTDEPSKEDHGGKPHEIKDGSHGDQKPMKNKPESKYDSKHNIDVDPKPAPKVEQKPTKDDKSARSTINDKK